MNQNASLSRRQWLLAATALIAGTAAAQDNPAPAKITAAEFQTRLTRDEAPLPEGGQLQEGFPGTRVDPGRGRHPEAHLDEQVRRHPARRLEHPLAGQRGVHARLDHVHLRLLARDGGFAREETVGLASALRRQIRGRDGVHQHAVLGGEDGVAAREEQQRQGPGQPRGEGEAHAHRGKLLNAVRPPCNSRRGSL